MFRFKHPSAANTSPEQKTEQSNRSTTPGGISWKKALAIGAVPLLLLFGTAFQSSNSVPAQLNAIQSQLNSLKPRQFYLTQTSHNGAQALSACAVGYHMASLYEIHEPSNLRYNTDLGFTVADSGFGPPNSHIGWIRTGSIAATTAASGVGNCDAWTSADAFHSGTAVRFALFWTGAGTTTSPWDAFVSNCSSARGVWCVQD